VPCARGIPEIFAKHVGLLLKSPNESKRAGLIARVGEIATG